MTKKRIIPLIAFLFFIFAAPVAKADVVKLGTLAPKGSPWHDLMQDLSEAWKEASQGQYSLRIYPGGVAGDEPDMVRKMRIGQLHAAALSGIGLHKIAPEIQALQLPMMYRNDEELDYVRSKIGERIERIIEKQGFKVLAWGDVGWVMFFSRKQVVHPDDMKPLKLFTSTGDTVVAEAYKDAGYQVVPLAATDIHTALQAGLIDAVQTTPVAALSFQWFGLAPHMAGVRWSPLVGAIVVSMKSWNKIPSDLQVRLMALSRAAGDKLQSSVRSLEAEALKVMQEYGLSVHSVPQELLPVWEERARLGYPALVENFLTPELFEEVERHRNAYRQMSASVKQ